MPRRTLWLDYLEALETEVRRIELALAYHPMSVDPMIDALDGLRPGAEIPEDLRDRAKTVLAELDELTARIENEMVDVAAPLGQHARDFGRGTAPVGLHRRPGLTR